MKQIIIRLSPAQALLLAQNIDGWMDAGANPPHGEEGLRPDEHDALESAETQIRKQIKKLEAKKR